jgi:Tol biopolymer transport system component/DNA-binding winged helix-turn-helix (wHTH) protein
MNTQRKVLYSFGHYRVEVAERRLWMGNDLISITPKAFETLVVLLEHKGRVLEKNFLLNEVWSDTYVGEATLAQNISTLRKTLGKLENGRPFIETVSGRGYRFIADVTEKVGDEEVFVVEPQVGTQITAEHEKISDDDINLQRRESGSRRIVSWKKAFISRLMNNKLRAAIVGLVGIFLFASVVLSLRFVLPSNNFSATKFKEIKIAMLTSDGRINRVAISLDGKYLAMVRQQNENRSLLVRQLDNSNTVEILPPQNARFRGLTFSPDSKQIYYVTFKRLDSSYTLIGTLYKISMLGGASQQIAADIDSPVAISPDGRQFAFIRDYPKERESALMIASLDGGSEQKKLAVRDIQSNFLISGLAWSPDGKTIVCSANSVGKNANVEALAVNALSGEQKLLTETKWRWVGQPAWLADGSGIVFSASNLEADSQEDDVWLVSYPQGAIRHITNGMNSSNGLSLTADSNTMVTVRSTRLTNFWAASAQNINQADRITQSLAELTLIKPGISWTTEGRILYGSSLNGNIDVWIMNADGSDKRQITSDPKADYSPIAASDGRFIIFVSNRSGKPNLWHVKPDGSDPKQLTDYLEASSPSIARDGQTIYFSASDEQNSKPFLHKMSINGGNSERITSLPTVFPKVSPDGKLIACYFPEILNGEPTGGNNKLTILSASDGKVVRQFDKTVNQGFFGQISWSNNQTLIYSTLENEVSKLWEQSLKKDDARLLIESASDPILGFDWWIEGQKLIYETSITINDIVLINSTNSERH